MTDVLIAGSGRSGLHAARMLAEFGVECLVVERLPQVGGQEPEPDSRTLERTATRAGVRFLSGTLAVSYHDGMVETLGVQGAQKFSVKALVLATGSRPRTRAELGIKGDRGAGVIPGSAAVHFLDSGLLLGRRPVVVGSGMLARHLAVALLQKGADEVVSVADGVRTGTWPAGVKCYDRSSVAAVHGFPRVTSVEIITAAGSFQEHTDAVVLASGRVAMRNVEGAIFPGESVFDCFTSGDPKTDGEAQEVATSTSRSVMGWIG